MGIIFEATLPLTNTQVYPLPYVIGWYRFAPPQGYCLVPFPFHGVSCGYLLSKRVDIGIDWPQTFTTVDVFRYIYDTYNSKQVNKLTYKEILFILQSGRYVCELK